MPNMINWFEIPVADMDRAKKFYETILDIEIQLNEVGTLLVGWFPADLQEHGASGTLIKAETYVPSHHGTMVYFFTPQIDEVVAKIEQAGGKVLNPKMSIGEHGYVAHFEDSEGNRVALHQPRR